MDFTLLRQYDWTPEQRESVAGLIVNPRTNGGTDRDDLTLESVLAQLDPNSPALAAFKDGRAVFVVLLAPWSEELRRGILHIAGTGELTNTTEAVQSFLDALPTVEIFAMTDRPALARMARRVGFHRVQSESASTIVLCRPRLS